MIPLSALRKSVSDALAYLRTIEDIEEAEAFASSNGQLLTRLNYTSHIPCNGVEEPKSTESFGIGIQAVFKTAQGRKIGFGSESSDISLEGPPRRGARPRVPVAGAPHGREAEAAPLPRPPAHAPGRR
jgi:PmbA protein